MSGAVAAAQCLDDGELRQAATAHYDGSSESSDMRNWRRLLNVISDKVMVQFPFLLTDYGDLRLSLFDITRQSGWNVEVTAGVQK